jgi:CubicO group peptidase (beta-lactamase class C family)
MDTACMRRCAVVLLFALLVPRPGAAQTSTPTPPALKQVLDGATSLPALRTVLVAQDGRILAERGYHGGSPGAPTNIKSASKVVVSTLVGIAIDRGVLDGVDQPIAPLLSADLPSEPDPRLAQVTIGHLLSMRAGLAPTSGPRYGAWVGTRNWVRAALAQPFVDEPGGGMLYSTGSSHLLSALLARSSGRSTLALANDWLGGVDGFAIAGWDRDPQGIHVGGNQMSMTPRSLLAFGEVFRRFGRDVEGNQVVSARWVAEAWRPRTRSIWSGDGYGYGWFARRIGGHDVRYAWGYGGQMLYIVPTLDLTVVMTSSSDQGAARSGHRDALHALLASIASALAPDADPPRQSR